MASKKKEIVTAVKAINNESFHIEVDLLLRLFRSNPHVTTYSFRSTLTNIERKYVHEKCRKLGIVSHSTGTEPNRVLTIHKRNNILDVTYDIRLNRKTQDKLDEFFKTHEITINSRKPPNRAFREECPIFIGWMGSMDDKQIEKPLKPPNQLRKDSLQLPVNSISGSLIDALDQNQVIILTAETGSGKTTQVPQIIMDDAARKGKACRIMCTQPRRLSTVTVAQRVAQERGETLPNSVGYQIKLECKLTPNASLIYSTTGVVLKTFMNERTNIKRFSHIIVDEIHERDRFTDFLLICLKEYLLEYPNIRLILMSATMNIELFLNYFPGAKVFNVRGRTYEIENYYLEDIIPIINYESQSMRRIKQRREAETRETVTDDDLNEEMDVAILNCMHDLDDFSQIWQMILSENVSVNYAEETNGYTPLMVAAFQGKEDVIRQLLYMGADKDRKCKKGFTAAAYASDRGHANASQILESYNAQHLNTEFSYSDYIQTVSPEFVDYELISNIIIHINEKIDNKSSILVFLSGYDEINSCHDAILHSRLNKHTVRVLMLHGSMNIADQSQVFKRIPCTQKIILATNVAETSLTIDDVAFVIDSGRVKEKTYDTLGNAFALTVNWISKASAMQRAGRAGRCKPGKCFRIYSRERYDSMLLTNIPEILTVPLQELCLHTKALAPDNVSIGNFLGRAMEPPTKVAIDKAIESLKSLGALDSQENLTSLGEKLLHLSVEPQYGKVLLYGITYRCLDPILTIISCLVNKDIFVLPPASQMTAAVLKKKKELAGPYLSDHLIYLKAFILYQNILCKGNCANFLKDYFLSESVLETVSATRSQLVSQLRALGYVVSRQGQNYANSNSDNWSVIKLVLLQGIYPNVAFYNRDALHGRTDNKIDFHKSSILKTSYVERKKSTWFMYNELSKANAYGTIKCATAVSPVTVALVSGTVTQPLEDNKYTIDNWIKFKVANENFYKFRDLIQHVNNLKLDNALHKFNQYENNIIDLAVFIVSSEDTANGFAQPHGIGVAPRVLTNRCAYTISRRMASSLVIDNLNLHIFIKVPTIDYIQSSVHHKKWKLNEQLLNNVTNYLNDGATVTLIFFLEKWMAFCGVARLINTKPHQMKLPVEWLSTRRLACWKLKNLRLPNLRELATGYVFHSNIGERLVNRLTN